MVITEGFINLADKAVHRLDAGFISFNVEAVAACRRRDGYVSTAREPDPQHVTGHHKNFTVNPD
ncbi:hypothetical protein L912_1382 [Escherichia coli SCD1]|nr:hypothetical protein L912_1382 [Escherichia coli SCD1]